MADAKNYLLGYGERLTAALDPPRRRLRRRREDTRRLALAGPGARWYTFLVGLLPTPGAALAERVHPWGLYPPVQTPSDRLEEYARFRR